MSKSGGKDKMMVLLSFAAAATTVIAGILHITMVPRSLSHDMGQGILFLVGGILQVFWTVPVIKQWGKVWQIIGIAGTAVLAILYFSSRLHLLPEGNMQGAIPQGNMPPGNFTREGIHDGNFSREGPRGPQGGLGSIGGSALPIELCQIAFIVLYSIQSVIISRRQKPSK